MYSLIHEWDNKSNHWFTNSKTFDKSFTQNQVRDDKMGKSRLKLIQDRVHIAQGGIWSFTNQKKTLMHTSSYDTHNDQVRHLSTKPKVQTKMWFFKQEWKLAMFEIWMCGSLKTCSNLKGVPMLELLGQLVNEVPDC
jgi:hypothetical protein